jgi:hypothetical protein
MVAVFKNAAACVALHSCVTTALATELAAVLPGACKFQGQQYFVGKKVTVGMPGAAQQLVVPLLQCVRCKAHTSVKIQVR